MRRICLIAMVGVLALAGSAAFAQGGGNRAGKTCPNGFTRPTRVIAVCWNGTKQWTRTHRHYHGAQKIDRNRQLRQRVDGRYYSGRSSTWTRNWSRR
ncbi:MAG TPA: hypothetical protein VFI02_17345 [Armatimonadota bacterium]|nr:hypothetical protein [Armatimonadota bacterium]